MIGRIKKYCSRYFTLGDLRRPIVPFKVNLLYWKPKRGDNVGDLLSKIVYDDVLKEMHLSPFCTPQTKRIALIGSVLSFVGGGKTSVWGTGLMNEECATALTDKNKKVRLDIRAVRGPLTRKALLKNGISCPDVYGDPAILMPLFYKPRHKKEGKKVVIIPHHSKLEKYRNAYEHVLDTYTSDWQGFIDEIACAKLVISSSLHGIILAESYGVPCVMLNDIPDSPFKYLDYYRSTGRDTFPIASTIEEAMKMDGDINHRLHEMQQNLLAAFPKDIFEEKK